MSEILYFGKTFDEIFEKSFKSFSKGIEDHNFRHFNKALGMYIYSKEHLKSEMKKRRLLPTEVCNDLATEWDSKHQTTTISEEGLSVKARDIINEMKDMSDRKGNLKLEGRAVDALVGIGAISKSYDFGTEGGFNDVKL